MLSNNLQKISVCIQHQPNLQFTNLWLIDSLQRFVISLICWNFPWSRTQPKEKMSMAANSLEKRPREGPAPPQGTNKNLALKKQKWQVKENSSGVDDQYNKLFENKNNSEVVFERKEEPSCSSCLNHQSALGPSSTDDLHISPFFPNVFQPQRCFVPGAIAIRLEEEGKLRGIVLRKHQRFEGGEVCQDDMGPRPEGPMVHPFLDPGVGVMFFSPKKGTQKNQVSKKMTKEKALQTALGPLRDEEILGFQITMCHLGLEKMT